ncbi:Nucleic-acid-binding protein from transposon X-element [Eumeta japonica]|uniref:Nucleic-acid-binding protein from transposon X-element n=1 Tax=Eumeta variegata TaxID=151549 RepID=A0A4C1S8U4_EUMVA|nr:Nucleic-acid-binding protein from transposon X-element [Eumeta japonica]
MRDIYDPARSRRIPNPVLRVGRSGIPVPVPRHPLPEPTGSVEKETEIDTDTSSESSTKSGKEDDDHDTITGTLATAAKRSRDALSSLSPAQESAPKKADQRSSIEAETPRSPSPEPYAEITLNSTAYAALAVEAGERRERYLSLPPPYLSSKRTQRWPPVLHVQKANSRTTREGSLPDRPLPSRERLVVESLPNWMSHFEELRRLLGHTPNARPFGKGVRHITWFCYAPVTERLTKIGIRGLPVDTAPDAIIAALQELGFPAEYARPIPPRKGRPGCLFYTRLRHTKQDGLQRLYGVNTLLNMPEVTIEGWRGRAGPPQCHRCQVFGHLSANCHRPHRCVRCGEGHLAADCPRPRDQKPTCANCQGPHPASDKRCPAFRREARQRGITIPPHTNRTEPHHLTPAASKKNQNQGRQQQCWSRLITGGQARAGYPSQGTESGETQYGRKAKREAEEAENRSIPTPASPASIRRPANAPAYPAYPGSRPGASIMTTAPQATRTEQLTPQIAATLPQTMPLTRLQHQGMPPMGPLTFARPLAKVTRGSQQLVLLTWMQARVMEALQAILTGQDPVTALLQVLLLDPAAHRPTSE